MTDQGILSVGTIGLNDYSATVEATDILPAGDVVPVLMGLYGEVGEVMAAAKKNVRERAAFPGYRAAAQEEFGDTLWYLAAYCRRQGISLEAAFCRAAERLPAASMLAASDVPNGAVAHVVVPLRSADIDQTLFQLGRAAAGLLEVTGDAGAVLRAVESFAACYLSALHAAGFSFAEIARSNIAKTRGAFVEPEPGSLPRFDDDFDEEERLPSHFRIRVNQRASGRSYLRWNDVFNGDPLTDNASDGDGYRFHDVFHFANAAVLHWSPVFRALIKQKRKGSALHDEVEDGGRAIVVEEGLTAWIFARAKQLNYFEGHDRVSYEILKTIKEFTAGYEVAQCPLKLWERSILMGYDVFRQLRELRGGWIEGDRETRRLRFEPL